MPPRSYYLQPRKSDYIAFAKAYFPEELENAINFVERFSRPYIRSDIHIAAYIGISPEIIEKICFNKEYHYRRFSILKPNGTDRIIASPRTYLKVIQFWILDNILYSVDFPDLVHGFRPGRGYYSNALSHIGTSHLLNIDIKEFFPNVSKKLVLNSFMELGYPYVAASIITELCTLDNSIPTGAPTSPAIGNLVLRNMDKQLLDFASLNKLNYTRYADDLTFSSKSWIDFKLLGQISEIVNASGFFLNKNKTKFMGRGNRMEVTGVTINSTPNLNRKWRNWARGFLYRAVTNPMVMSDKKNTISGIYGALKALDPQESNKLTQLAKRAVFALKNNS